MLDCLDKGPVLIGVLQEDYAARRADAWPWLEKIAERSRGRYLAEDIWGFVESGDLQLWLFLRDGAVSGVILTEVISFPRTKEARLFGAAGRNTLDSAGYVVSLLSAWAKSVGCSRLTAGGRPGWARALPGMQFRDVVVERDL